MGILLPGLAISLSHTPRHRTRGWARTDCSAMRRLPTAVMRFCHPNVRFFTAAEVSTEVHTLAGLARVTSASRADWSSVAVIFYSALRDPNTGSRGRVRLPIDEPGFAPDRNGSLSECAPLCLSERRSEDLAGPKLALTGNSPRKPFGVRFLDYQRGLGWEDRPSIGGTPLHQQLGHGDQHGDAPPDARVLGKILAAAICA
jgi:hypothetical protein